MSPSRIGRSWGQVAVCWLAAGVFAVAGRPAAGATLSALFADIRNEDASPPAFRILQTSPPGVTVKVWGTPTPFNWVNTGLPINSLTIMVQGTISGDIALGDRIRGDIDFTPTFTGGSARVTSIEFFADSMSGPNFIEQVVFVDSTDRTLASGQPFVFGFNSTTFIVGGDNGIWTLFIGVDWLNGTTGQTFGFSIPQQSIDLTFVPAGTEQFPMGDLNEDCIVDIQDLNLVLGNFNSMNLIADANGDGNVDFLDLNVILGNFREECP